MPPKNIPTKEAAPRRPAPTGLSEKETVSRGSAPGVAIALYLACLIDDRRT
jgi:hypothetical protein